MADHFYGERIRVRVNGILIEKSSVLLAQIQSPVSGELIWTPPGGGLEFGETLEHCLKREFLEETGLRIKVSELVYINELVKSPFHAIELYFSVTKAGGTLTLGTDPEHHPGEQYLQDVKWISLDEIDTVNLAPAGLSQVLSGGHPELDSTLVYSSFIKDP